MPRVVSRIDSRRGPPPGMTSVVKAEWLQVDGETRPANGRALYRLRQQTVEPVYGIIKAVLGFTGFSLRGLDKVAGEWDLVALAYWTASACTSSSWRWPCDGAVGPTGRSKSPATAQKPRRSAAPSLRPNTSSRFRRTSIAPLTDDSEITQHRNPTRKSDTLLACCSDVVEMEITA